MPVSTTENISIDEILKKLEVAGPLTATQLLNFFIGDTDQLRLIQRTTLNRLEGLSRTVLDNLTSEVYNKLKDPTISKKMVDPLGLVELRPEYKRKTEEILNKSVQNISNELDKIKIKEVELNESLNKSLENKINQIKVEDVDLNKIISDKIETIDLSSMVASLPTPAPITTPPTPASSTTSPDLSTLLKDLNKTLKGLKRKPKQEPTKVTFSSEALKRLQNISGFDKGLIQQLEQRILSDPSTKIKQAFIRREMPGKRVVYEPGEKTIGLNEKSLRSIFDSLNISNDDQEKLLFALSTESKEIKEELKSFKKGMLESPWAMLLNGIAKFFTDLFLLGTLAIGGGVATLIGKYFGPSILGIVDKLFGTQLAPAFDNVTKPLQALGSKLTAVAAAVVAAGAAIAYLGVAGLKLSAKLTGAALNFVVGKPLRALGRTLTGGKSPTTSTPTPVPSSVPPTGRITLPSGAYVEGGKAFSAAGKPLYGSAARSVLSKASAVPPPPAPGPTPVVSGASRLSRLGRLAGRLGPYLAIAGESYRGYEEYSTEAEAIEEQQRMGVLSAAEAERERTKAKGRAVGKTAIRTGTGLAGALGGAKLGALAGGAIGSVVPIVGTAAGAVVGGLIGGIGGYMAGQYAGEKVGLEQLGSDIGEGTSELLFSPSSKETPTLQPVEQQGKSASADLNNTLQFAENKVDESKTIQQQGFSSMIAGIGDMIGRLDQIREALLMSPGGGVANNVNILGGSGESSSDSVTTVSRIDPVLYNRSLYYNSIIGPRALT